MPQNLFKIYDGRNYFWQWDIGQKLIVLDDMVDEVHFSNRGMTHSICAEVYKEADGTRVCDVPDVILMLPKNLVASAYDTDGFSDNTIKSVKFAVRQRPIPSNYISNQTGQIEELVNRMVQLEEELASMRPSHTTITLFANSWVGDISPFSQVISIENVTENSKVDLQPTAVQIVELQDTEISLMAENNAGVVTVWAIGDRPEVDYTMQALITEVTPV